MNRQVGPVGRGKSGLETPSQIVIPLIGVLGLARAAAAEDISAFIHRRQYRGSGQIKICRGRAGSIVRIVRVRIIGLRRYEAIQLILRGGRGPIRNGTDLFRGCPDSKLFKRCRIEDARPGKSGLRLKRQYRLSCIVARYPVQSPGIEATFCEDRLSLLSDRIVAGCLGDCGQSNSRGNHQPGQQSIPRSTRHHTHSRWASVHPATGSRMGTQ
jgi:hypothetical protein